MNTYTILSSTANRTIEFGRYHAHTARKALTQANKDLDQMRNGTLYFSDVSAQRLPERPELWIDLHECADCGEMLGEEQGVNGMYYCLDCYTSVKAKGR